MSNANKIVRPLKWWHFHFQDLLRQINNPRIRRRGRMCFIHNDGRHRHHDNFNKTLRPKTYLILLFFNQALKPTTRNRYYNEVSCRLIHFYLRTNYLLLSRNHDQSQRYHRLCLHLQKSLEGFHFCYKQKQSTKKDLLWAKRTIA